MNNDLMKIRLSDVLHAIIKWRIMIGILTLAGLVVGILLSAVSYLRGEMLKEYAISSSFAVTSVTEDGLFSSRTSNPNSTDIYLAENMVDSVIYVIKSDKTLNAAIDWLNLVGISAREISKNLTLKQYNKTQIVEMTLYWRSAEEGIQILNAINHVSPGILIKTLKIGDLSVVSDPTSRYLVGGSVNAAIWIYMAILGFIIGCGLSVLNALLRPTLINPKDAEYNFDLEIIGVLPEDRPFFSRKHLAGQTVDEGDEGGENQGIVAEEFGSAAHILRNRLQNSKPQFLYITSATAKEGKTSIAANLAVQLADLEQKVLLIDFDVRNPTLGGLFMDKVDYYHSLNALYRGETTQEDAITHLTGFLDLLPSILEKRTLPLDEAMMTMVSGLTADYDYVLMDTAPVGQAADTMNLNKIAQAALFVIRYDTSTISEIQEALDRLDKSGISVVGTIVNGVKKANANSSIKNPFERSRVLFESGKGRESIDDLNEIVSREKKEKGASKAPNSPPAEAQSSPAASVPDSATSVQTQTAPEKADAEPTPVAAKQPPETEPPETEPPEAEPPEAAVTAADGQPGQEQKEGKPDGDDPFLMLAKSLGKPDGASDKKQIRF